MFALKKPSLLYLSIVAIAASGCGNNDAGDVKASECRTIKLAELTHDTYMCALAEETQALADTLATIVDQASADRAIPSIRKSAARIENIRAEAPRLNEDPKAGGKGAVSARYLPQINKANRAMVDEMQRLTKERRELWTSVGPALEAK